MKKLLYAILGLFIILLLGEIIPMLIIPSGENSFTGDKKLFAQYALYETESLTGDSAEPIFITDSRVVTVEKISNNKSKNCIMGPNQQINGDYRGTVKLYTIFGIPYGTAIVECDRSRIDRKFF